VHGVHERDLPPVGGEPPDRTALVVCSAEGSVVALDRLLALGAIEPVP